MILLLIIIMIMILIMITVILTTTNDNNDNNDGPGLEDLSLSRSLLRRRSSRDPARYKLSGSESGFD